LQIANSKTVDITLFESQYAPRTRTNVAMGLIPERNMDYTRYSRWIWIQGWDK